MLEELPSGLKLCAAELKLCEVQDRLDASGVGLTRASQVLSGLVLITGERAIGPKEDVRAGLLRVYLQRAVEPSLTHRR